MNKNKEKIELIKFNYLKKKNKYREIPIYADNKIIIDQKAVVLKINKKNSIDFWAKNSYSDQNYFIPNFFWHKINLSKINFDLVIVDIKFKIIKVVKSGESIDWDSISFWKPINIWLLKKDFIDFYKIREKKILSNRALIINQ